MQSLLYTTKQLKTLEMEKIAIFPGSFDPFTIGHEAIIHRALPLFDKIVIGIGYNSSKIGYFPLGKRKAWIEAVFEDEPKVEVDMFQGLTVDFCKKHNASHILRGLRTSADFEYERAIAQINKQMHPPIETIFILTTPELTPVASNIVRDIIRHGGDASQFLPEKIKI